MKQQLLSHDEIATLCTELRLLLHAGADCGSGLMLLSEETTDPGRKALFADMSQCIDEGGTLAQAFEASKAAPHTVCAMLSVGETTGRTEEALDALAQYYDRSAQVDRYLRSALLYPSVLMLVMLAVIVVLLTTVLPIFQDVYASLGSQLTGIAWGLLEFGRILGAILPWLCVVLAPVVVFLLLFACSGQVRTRILNLWLAKSGDKGVAGKLTTAQFARALAMATGSGLTTDAALDAAEAILADQPTAVARVHTCRELTAAGESFARSLGKSGLMPQTECRLLELGQMSGSSETAMSEIARRLDDEAQNSMELLLGRIEPTMVVISSLLVGMILLSVMLPLTHIMSAIG